MVAASTKDMKELGTLFTILVVGALSWCFLPLIGGQATGQKVAAIVPSRSTVVDYRVLAKADAEAVGIDPALFQRQIEAESGFNPRAVSRTGALGIAQIEPTTAASWHVDPHDPV